MPQRELLLGLHATRKFLFPGPEAPSERTWADWKARGYFSVVKIGRRVFCDPSVVRSELIEKFKVPASSRKPRSVLP